MLTGRGFRFKSSHFVFMEVITFGIWSTESTLQHLKDPGRWDGESHPRQSLGSETGAWVVPAGDSDGQEANSGVARVPGGCATGALPY